MLTPDELRQIRRLHVQAARRVDSPFSGDYRTAVRGQGMEFEEVRAYVPGDDVRHLDWNVTARTGEPFIKVFGEERELTVQLVLDTSASQRFGGGGQDGRTDKRLQMARIAGALAFAAIRTGDRVGLLSFNDRIETFLPPRKSRGHAWAVIEAAFEVQREHRGTDLALALDHVGKVLKRRAAICVLSDFLVDAPFDRELATLCRRHTVHAFCVHDPLEEAFPGVGLVEVEDLETGRRRLIDAASWTSRFSVAARIERLQRAGARARAISTADDPFVALVQHFRRVEQLR